MRGLRLIAISVVLIACDNRLLAEPVSISALVDPVVETRLAEIAGPLRRVAVDGKKVVPLGGTGRQVEVYGSISDAEISSLLGDAGYFADRVYRIVGDSTFARIMAFCSTGCASQHNAVFRRSQSRWQLLYHTEPIACER